jgi:hypothetical protein
MSISTPTAVQFSTWVGARAMTEREREEREEEREKRERER